MEQEIANFISKKFTPNTSLLYSDFCDWIHNETEYHQDVTSLVFSNLEFKKELAKEIVRVLLYDRDNSFFPFRLQNDSIDIRLRSLIKYYLSVQILGDKDLSEEIIRKVLSSQHCDYSHTSWIEGRKIIDTSVEAIVRMRLGDPLYQGYRFFIVNMLCFTADKFVLGFRTDGGPVRSSMKYYKGCKPLGKRKSDDGKEWNLIIFDRTLSDDHIAVFSNQLDGDGSIEICDWLSEHIHRVVFRCDY